MQFLRDRGNFFSFPEADDIWLEGAEHAVPLCPPTINARGQYSSNRRFPKITGEDNLTVFSYSGRVKSPEWRRQRGRADLQA